jgi:hypothetical protein
MVAHIPQLTQNTTSLLFLFWEIYIICLVNGLSIIKASYLVQFTFACCNFWCASITKKEKIQNMEQYCPQDKKQRN